MTATAFRLVVVNAGVSDPSSTKLLADRAAQRVASHVTGRGSEVTVTVIDLRELLPELPAALSSQHFGPRFLKAIGALRDADGIVAASPVYKAGASGLFTSFFQVLDNDLLIGKPVILAATAGTARHALVVDEEMRSLFAYLRTLTVPTSLFASTEDWSDKSLTTRIDRAAFELTLLMESGFARAVRDESWGNYQHEYGSAGGTELGVDLDSDLMRLATGGSGGPQRGRKPAAATTAAASPKSSPAAAAKE
jgi:FMN reductase